jgi:ABC-type antimicrobial peptide transport system permease subunit
LRWKLLIATSLVAALIGAGASYGLVYLLYHVRRPYPPTLTLLIIVESVFLVMSIIAGIFVYRHTARRRKVQVFITVLLCLLLSQAFLRLAVALVAPFYKTNFD